MKKIVCYKYIIRDNQQIGGYIDYTVSSRYFSSQKAAEKAINGIATEYCFRVIKPFRISRQVGEIAELLTQHEERGG